MSKIKEYFKPTWKKLGWLILCYLVAQSYYEIIINFVSLPLFNSIIFFLLKPITSIISQSQLESIIITPLANTLDLIWLYILASVFSKEISKEKN